MILIYLDQNKWIEIAQVVNGRLTPDERMKVAVEWVVDQADRDTIRLPLSHIHYFETMKIKDHARRARLGEVLWRLSKGWTTVPYDVVMKHELDGALRKFFRSSDRPKALEYLGRGIAHAFGDEKLKLRPTRSLRRGLSQKKLKRFIDSKQLELEKSFLTGIAPDGEEMTLPDHLSKYSSNFCEHIEKVRKHLSSVPGRLHGGALALVEVLDLGQLFHDALVQYRVDPADFLNLGVDGVKRLVAAMPARSVDLHLHQQYLKNKDLKAKLTDLNDWAGLSVGVMYCDTVVCENQFADLVGRDGFQTEATVLTDLRELPNKL
jgi:hypothetical protein